MCSMTVKVPFTLIPVGGRAKKENGEREKAGCEEDTVIDGKKH